MVGVVPGHAVDAAKPHDAYEMSGLRTSGKPVAGFGREGCRMDLVVTDGEGIDCAFKVEGVVAREPEFNAGVGRKRSLEEGIGFERNALCVCTGYHDEGEAQGARSLMNLIHTLFFICFVFGFNVVTYFPI